jgi:multicomponent Na+:H+ antiporter subunit D
MLAFAALQMAFGGLIERGRAARLSLLSGTARAMPVSAFLMLAAGLAVAGVPGFALYATQAVALEATAQWELLALWLMIAALSAVVFISLALRPALAANRPLAKPPPRNEAPFTMLLGAGLAIFLCLLVGLAPRWLYDLMPAELTFQPFALDRMAPQLELLGVAGLAMMLLGLGGQPKRAPARLLDVDALYRGPVAAAGAWTGVVMLRLYGAWQAATARLSRAAAERLGRWASACDRPFGPRGAANVAQFLCVGAVVMLILLFS